MTMQRGNLVYLQGGVWASGPQGLPTGSCHHAVQLYVCSGFCITCTKRLDSCNIYLCLRFKAFWATETWWLTSPGSWRQPYVPCRQTLHRWSEWKDIKGAKLSAPKLQNSRIRKCLCNLNSIHTSTCSFVII